VRSTQNNFYWVYGTMLEEEQGLGAGSLIQALAVKEISSRPHF
jgi:hypothetical protein